MRWLSFAALIRGVSQKQLKKKIAAQAAKLICAINKLCKPATMAQVTPRNKKYLGKNLRT